MANAPRTLMLRYAADTVPARRAIQELAATGVSQMALLAGATAAAGRKMDGGLLATIARLAAGITGLQLAYAGFAAVAASSLAIAIDRMAEYRRLAESAASIGVSTDFFQKFTQSAGQAAESAKLMQQALQAAKGSTRETLDGSPVGARMDEFARNGGLGASGMAGREAYRAASTVEERVQASLRVIDDLIARGRDLEALDLGEKLFGREAADALFERARRAGASLTEMVNTTADKKIVSPEQVENARQLEERLSAARALMADGMRPVLEDLERLGRALYSGWVSTEEAIAKAVSMAGALYKAVKAVVDILPSATNIGGPVAATMEARVSSLNQQIASLERGGVFDPRLAGLKAQREQLQAGVRAAQGQDMLANDAIPAVAVPAVGGPITLGKNDPLNSPFARPPRRPITDLPNPAPAKSGGGGGGGTDSDLEFYEKYVSGIEKASVALKTEIETLGLSTFAREKAMATAKAYAEFKAKDIELSDEQKAKLDAMIEAQARLKEQLENTKNAMQAQRDLVNFIGSSVSGFFSDIVSGGKNAEQALMNLGKKLADAAFQAALLGQGPLAQLFGMAGTNGNAGGLLGALFGGLKGSFGGGGAAAVNFNSTGAYYDVGTDYVNSDQLAKLHKGEAVLTRAQNEARLREMRRNSGSEVTINVAGTGNAEVRDMVALGVQQGMAQLAAGEQSRNRAYKLRMA